MGAPRFRVVFVLKNHYPRSREHFLIPSARRHTHLLGGLGLIGPGDAAAQTRQVFQNIGGVLESAGAGFSNVVEFTTYVVGRDSVQGFIDGRNRVFPDIFPNGDYPPNTLLVVNGLVRDEFLVEIKAVAALS